jgi:hypothetical protein
VKASADYLLGTAAVQRMKQAALTFGSAEEVNPESQLELVK